MADKTQIAEAASMKRLAFFGIAISTIATMTAVIAIPMVYTYLQHIESSIKIEVDFCSHRSQGLIEELQRLEEQVGLSRRHKRYSEQHQRVGRRNQILRGAATYDGGSGSSGGYSSGQAISAAPAEALGGGGGSGGCCGGCSYGPPGPPGKDGSDGKDGTDGQPGKNFFL